ncbi:MAG: Coenzyme F420 hydrogenase/dehydrogenase, beta subunit C-terminal domain [Synergistaceae bacterium]|nr:Coenzyme F420 hydrogenase/dehydrogenase, beta subunit C-terminal domain [Synergistaceae bacterium]
MFIDSGDKSECFGCEACVQVCGVSAITMQEDAEGFRYPVVDYSLCVRCNKCRKVCPYENMPQMHEDDKYTFGGYHLNNSIRFDSTSGGAFSAIVEAFCDENYVIFGAEAEGLKVFHSYVTDKSEIWRFRKSKYSQSIIGTAYRDAKRFLLEGRKVLFSGTPCQIAGLLSFLEGVNQDKLLTVEVICEGVPSPLYVRKLDDAIEAKYGARIESIDYRYTGRSVFSRGKWDFQRMMLMLGKNTYGGGGTGRWDFEMMRITLMNKQKILTKDRWFNPFWSIWLQHLMSRPSCYRCKFASRGRTADITLGDLWGVHIYCPELYGNNGGASLVVCNTSKGREVFRQAERFMYGHKLSFEEALKYQSPMRKTISTNPNREAFMRDLRSGMSYRALAKKWAKKPTIKLLFQKYVWGNRQKVFVWNLKHAAMNIIRKKGKM